MATLLSRPLRPIPGRPVEITFSGLDAGTTHVRVYAVAAPAGSAVRQRIDQATKERPILHEGPVETPWSFTPDRGGVYRFFVEEIKQTPSSGALFQHDPAGAEKPEILATSNVLLQVGQRMQHTLGTGRDTAQLRVYVWGSTVYATNVAEHGEATPAVVLPTSQTAANAAADSDVVTAVADLAGKTAATIVGNPASVFASLRSAYAAHIANNTVHDAKDEFNTVGAGYAGTNAAALRNAINVLRQKLRGHQDNLVDRKDPENIPPEPHDNIDGSNHFLVAGAADVASAIPALVDCWLTYEGHRKLGAPVHNSADNTNVGPSLSPLMTVHRRFLEALFSHTPNTPPDTNEGVSALSQLAGFVEAP